MTTSPIFVLCGACNGEGRAVCDGTGREEVEGEPVTLEVLGAIP